MFVAHIRDKNTFRDISLLRESEGVSVFGGRLKKNLKEKHSHVEFPAHFSRQMCSEWLDAHSMPQYAITEKEEKQIETFTESFSASSMKKEGKEWEIVIIESGMSKNGREYTESALKAGVDKFNGAYVYAHRFGESFDHRMGLPQSTDQSKLTENVVGYIDNVRFERKDGKGRLVGTFHCTSEPLKETMRNAFDAGKKGLLGFSIDAIGGVRKKGRVTEVYEIKHVNSVDVVTEPAAGGRFERLVASSTADTNGGIVMEKLIEALVAKAKEGTLKLSESIEGKSDADIASMVKTMLDIRESDKSEKPKKEAVKAASDEVQEAAMLSEEGVRKIVKEMMNFGKKKDDDEEEYEKKKKKERTMEAEQPNAEQSEFVKESMKKIEEMQRAMEHMAFQNVLESVLTTSNIPEKSKARVRKSFDGKVGTEESVREAVQEEREFLDEIMKTQAVQESTLRVLSTPKDRLEANIAVTIDPELASLDEYKDGMSYGTLHRMFESATGERIEDAIANNGERITEATSSDFTVTLSNVMNKSLRIHYEEHNAVWGWEKFVSKKRLTDLKEQSTVGYGGFADLSRVLENADFTSLSAPTEENPKYTPFKIGNTFNLTIEAMAKDDLKSFQQFPRWIAEAGARTIAKTIYDLLFGYDSTASLPVINGATIYDGAALYGTRSGVNTLGSAALSSDNFNAAYALMQKQVSADGNPIANRPKYLLVPHALRATARQIIINDTVATSDGSTSIPNINKDLVEIFEVHPQFIAEGNGNENEWLLIGDPKRIGVIEYGYYLSETPQVYVQDNATVGDVFTNDRITWKIRHFYGAAILDYRGLYGSFPSL